MHLFIFKAFYKYKNEALDTKCPPPGSYWRWPFAKTWGKRQNGQPLSLGYTLTSSWVSKDRANLNPGLFVLTLKLGLCLAIRAQ